MAVNDTTLTNDQDTTSDWIELYNAGTNAMDLAGWHLTDNAGNLDKWTFPSTNLPSGGYLMVYASNLDLINPPAPLHTDFVLSGNGEYLALVEPDGTTIAHEYAPMYPRQSGDVSYGLLPGTVTTNSAAVYMTTPTPGALNVVSGPHLSDLTKNTPQPAASSNLVISVTATNNGNAISNVVLHYRVDFGAETSPAMVDDGSGDDAIAGDGIYTATIDASNYGAGDMVRWRVTAVDVASLTSSLPAFVDPLDSPEYHGTVVVDPSITTPLDVLYWFVEDPQAARWDAGTRASLYFRGEFYDNIYVRRRGFTTANWPKRKFKMDFNAGDHFRAWQGSGRVEEINLQSHQYEVGGSMGGTRTSYLRETAAFQFMRDAGVTASRAFHVHLRQNGAFYGLYSIIEQVDERFLEERSFNPDGVLYKSAGSDHEGNLRPNPSIGGYAKLNPPDDDFSDLAALCAGINASNPTRETYLFDHVDLPGLITEMAAHVTMLQHDRLPKNYYMYRDAHTFEWTRFPWDIEQAFEVNAAPGTWNFLTGENHNSPLYGDSEHPQSIGTVNYNHLYDAILDVPRTRAMYVRRLRTLMDMYLEQTAGGYFETLVTNMAARIEADADADNLIWGAGDIDDGVSEILDTSLPTRRTQLFTTYGPGGSTPLIPAAQAGTPAIGIAGLEYQPASGNQDEEYIILTNANAVAVDISGWRLNKGVSFVFRPGTVISAGAALYVSPDVAVFRGRATAPTGGQSLFVQGPYGGHLSSFGETVQLLAADWTVVAETNYPGNPTDQQRCLRVSELHYNPAAPNPALGELSVDSDEFEFIELLNTDSNTLDLTDVRITNAVSFTFGVTNLAAGDRILVVKNLAAFESRYGTGLNVAGVYAGSLNNGGETVKIEDGDNATIAEFTYNDARGWPLAAGGAGHSLVPLAWTDQPHGALSYGGNWRCSAHIGGSPGAADPVLAKTVVINEFAAHTDYSAGQPWQDSNDKIELYNAASTTVTFNSEWYLSDNARELTKWRISSASIASGAWVYYTEVDDFHTATNVGFGLNKSGEQIFLSHLPAAVTNSRVVDCVRFKGQENGVTLGYLADGDTAWFALSPTFGGANSIAGDHLVIDEIMYHPHPDVKDNEYIEIYNPTASSVTLQESEVLAWGPPHWSETWRIDGGVSFSFPSNTVIAAGDRIVLVSFDPTNTVTRDAFLAAYGLTNGQVRLLGPFEGDLSNEGERLALEKPQAPDAQTEPQSWVIIDEVITFDRAPWNAAADSGGVALQRKDPPGDGNDPASWGLHPTGTPGTLPGLVLPLSLDSVGVSSATITASNATVFATLRSPNGMIGSADVWVAWADAGDQGTNALSDWGAFSACRGVFPTYTQVNVSFDGTLSAETEYTFRLFATNSSSGAHAWSDAGAFTTADGRTVIPITVDDANTTAPGLGTTKAGLTNDVFAYDHDDGTPAVPAPNQHWAGEIHLYRTATAGGTVDMDFVDNYTNIVLDLWGRDDYGRFGLSFHRNLTITFYRDHDVQTHQVTAWNGVSAKTDSPPSYGRYTPPADVQADRVTIRHSGDYLLLAEVRAAGEVSVVFDADGDGLPDAWENRYFGGTSATYAGHGDADGMSNGGEYTAGTDPTNTTSVFSIEILPGDGAPVVRFTALAASGPGYEGFERYYELEYASNLVSGYWFAVAGRTNILGQDQIVTYTNAQTRTTSYRARAELRD